MWAGKGSLIARNLRGGTGRLPAAMGRELGERARVNARVDAISEDGGHWSSPSAERRSARGT